jgi:hypothetical protein
MTGSEERRDDHAECLGEPWRHGISNLALDLVMSPAEPVVQGKRLQKGSLAQRDPAILNWMNEASAGGRRAPSGHGRRGPRRVDSPIDRCRVAALELPVTVELKVRRKLNPTAAWRDYSNPLERLRAQAPCSMYGISFAVERRDLFENVASGVPRGVEARRERASEVSWRLDAKGSIDAQCDESPPVLRDTEVSGLDHVLRHDVVAFHLRDQSRKPSLAADARNIFKQDNMWTQVRYEPADRRHEGIARVGCLTGAECRERLTRRTGRQKIECQPRGIDPAAKGRRLNPPDITAQEKRVRMIRGVCLRGLEIVFDGREDGVTGVPQPLRRPTGSRK